MSGLGVLLGLIGAAGAGLVMVAVWAIARGGK